MLVPLTGSRLLALTIVAIQLFNKPANANTKLFPEKVKEDFIITF